MFLRCLRLRYSDECVRTSYVVMRGSCGLLVRLSATSRLWVGGRCVARTREAHLDVLGIYMSFLPVARPQ